MPWPDAEAWATKLGGHLVTINDQAEETWLEATFPGPHWIGLNDVAQEGNWVWSSGEQITFTKWIPEQPDNALIVPEGEDFGVMNWTYNDAFGWDDWDGASIGSIIEVANLPTVSTGTLTITASTTLTQDHFGNIVVASDNVTLDCAGHTVVGPGDEVGILLAGRTRVTVRNCTVTGFVRAFVLSGSSHNRLEHNAATHNGTAYGTGFFVTDGSNANVLEQNSANDNGDPGTDTDGFRVQDSNNNLLHANVANGNATWGFIVVTGSGNVLNANVANGNALIGFALHGAVSTALAGNSADANGVTNFDLCCQSTGNTLRNNTSSNSGTGFAGNESSNNAFVANAARNNAYDGFWIWGSVGGTFSGNTITNNGNDGFAVYASSDLVVDHNVSQGNGWNGFIVQATTDSRFTANTASANREAGVGFWVRWGSDRNVLAQNLAKDNLNTGFILEQANSNRLAKNTSDHNGVHGFAFHGSNDLLAENNSANGVRFTGFALDGGTSGATLAGNTVTGCDSGFSLDATTGDKLTGNKVSGSRNGPGFALGPGADSNVLSANSAIDNTDGFLLWSYGNGGPAPSHNLFSANIANRNTVNGFAVQTGASYNSFVRNLAHANGDWDAIQNEDAGPGNLWIGNRFGVTAGF